MANISIKTQCYRNLFSRTFQKINQKLKKLEPKNDKYYLDIRNILAQGVKKWFLKCSSLLYLKNSCLK